MKLNTFTAGAVIAVLALTGCSSDQRKVDYKSAKSLPPLEVPPDLQTPENSSRYTVFEEDGATYSDYTRARAAASDSSETKVLPKQERMRVEGEGNFRWLVVDSEPEVVWQPIREFWQETGFLIARESPESGVMETDWAENRAMVPNSWFRRTFAFMGADRVYSSSERDRFHTRVERGKEPGTSEIFITHRGVYQKVTQDTTIARIQWEARPRDPNLEAEMLYLLMARLGATDTQIQRVRQQPPPPPRAELASGPENVEYLELQDPFDRAWRRVGLALDFIGFTVEDRDRSQGVYFVRYNDPDADPEKQGLERLAFWRDAERTDQTFQIQVSRGTEAGSEVHVLDEQGTVLANPTSSRILVLLRDELR